MSAVTLGSPAQRPISRCLPACRGNFEGNDMCLFNLRACLQRLDIRRTGSRRHASAHGLDRAGWSLVGILLGLFAIAIPCEAAAAKKRIVTTFTIIQDM